MNQGDHKVVPKQEEIIQASLVGKERSKLLYLEDIYERGKDPRHAHNLSIK